MYLPAYSIAEAARYSGVHKSTVAYWHYHTGKYGQVLPGKEKGKPLSYFQLIEVGVVAAFRRANVKLKKIAMTRDYLAQVMESEFPFVEFQFKEHGPHMMLDLQQMEPRSELAALVLADTGGQMKWNDEVLSRLDEFDYEYNVAMKWHVAGRGSPVLIDPRVSFGAPTIAGVPTWALRGRVDAGEEPPEIAEDFNISEDAVIEALRFEGILMAA
jgi:uncharacterized protein (DUF433 family)